MRRPISGRVRSADHAIEAAIHRAGSSVSARYRSSGAGVRSAADRLRVTDSLRLGLPDVEGGSTHHLRLGRIRAMDHHRTSNRGLARKSRNPVVPVFDWLFEGDPSASEFGEVPKSPVSTVTTR
jgi:hypothetical protein